MQVPSSIQKGKMHKPNNLISPSPLYLYLRNPINYLNLPIYFCILVSLGLQFDSLYLINSFCAFGYFDSLWRQSKLLIFFCLRHKLQKNKVVQLLLEKVAQKDWKFQNVLTLIDSKSIATNYFLQMLALALTRPQLASWANKTHKRVVQHFLNLILSGRFGLLKQLKFSPGHFNSIKTFFECFNSNQLPHFLPLM